MSSSFYYYRCPCPANDCNGAICRYPEIMPSPVSTFSSPSCTRFAQNRKLLHFSADAKETKSTATGKLIGQSSSTQSLRWNAHQGQGRIASREVHSKTAVGNGKMHLFFWRNRGVGHETFFRNPSFFFFLKEEVVRKLKPKTFYFVLSTFVSNSSNLGLDLTRV